MTSWKARLAHGLHVPDALKRQLGWTTAGYAVTQVVRFITNLVLTHILAPDLFGLMILLTSIRVGIELFTDIGIGQNVIASPRTRDPDFYNTAWTLQVLRGLALALILFIFLPILQHIYEKQTLNQILPTLALFFILTGAHSVAPSIAVKELRTKRIALFDIYSVSSQTFFAIGAVLISPTIWGLLSGQLLGTLAAAIGSYFVLPDVHCRFRLDRKVAFQITNFGKWIFISSVVFFLSSYLDRLILGKYATLAMLGVYGIARSLADIFGQFSNRLGNAIIFPKIASTPYRGRQLCERVAKPRGQLLVVFLASLSIFIAMSDPIIHSLYDNRYGAAAQVLPWVGLASWLSILCTTNDFILLGLSKPHYSALGNFAKLSALVTLLPFAIIRYGITGAAAATAASELTRYVVLAIGQFRQRVTFIRQDVAATAALLIAAMVIHILARDLVPDRILHPLFQLIRV